MEVSILTVLQIIVRRRDTTLCWNTLREKIRFSLSTTYNNTSSAHRFEVHFDQDLEYELRKFFQTFYCTFLQSQLSSNQFMALLKFYFSGLVSKLTCRVVFCTRVLLYTLGAWFEYKKNNNIAYVICWNSRENFDCVGEWKRKRVVRVKKEQGKGDF